MNQSIVGFHKDFENHWVAELECGHGQHVRHDPPWNEREWTQTEAGRASFIGKKLNCVRCDEAGLMVAEVLAKEFKKAIMDSYQSAGMSGLCGEGRIEAALGSLENLDLKEIIEKALIIKK